MLVVVRIEVHDILRSGARDGIKKLRGKVTVGIDESHPSTGANVLGQNVFEQRALPGAGLADDIGVVAPVNRGEGERTLAPVSIKNAKCCPVLRLIVVPDASCKWPWR